MGNFDFKTINHQIFFVLFLTVWHVSLFTKMVFKDFLPVFFPVNCANQKGLVQSIMAVDSFYYIFMYLYM